MTEHHDEGRAGSDPHDVDALLRAAMDDHAPPPDLLGRLRAARSDGRRGAGPADVAADVDVDADADGRRTITTEPAPLRRRTWSPAWMALAPLAAAAMVAVVIWPFLRPPSAETPGDAPQDAPPVVLDVSPPESGDPFRPRVVAASSVRVEPLDGSLAIRRPTANDDVVIVWMMPATRTDRTRAADAETQPDVAADVAADVDPDTDAGSDTNTNTDATPDAVSVAPPESPSAPSADLTPDT